jgi:hypothetical protein
MNWDERFPYSTHHLLWRCVCIEVHGRSLLAATNRTGVTGVRAECID